MTGWRRRTRTWRSVRRRCAWRDAGPVPPGSVLARGPAPGGGDRLERAGGGEVGIASFGHASPAVVFVVAAPPVAGFVATQGPAVEPPVHAPHGVPPALLHRGGVVHDARP